MKVFNVDQLRIGGLLLTGSPEGLFFDSDNDGFGQKLAQGTSAVPVNRTLTAGSGMKFYDGIGELGNPTETVSLENNRAFYINVDNSTMKINPSNDQLYVNDIGPTEVNATLAGAGLSKANTSAPLLVGGGTGIAPEGGFVNIDLKGVDTLQLADLAVENDQLSVITADDKFRGNALMHDANDFSVNGSTYKLEIKDGAIGTSEISENVAGLGLLGGFDGTNGASLDVGGGSGIHVEGDFVNLDTDAVIDVKVSAYNASDLTKGITNSKLHPIKQTNLVEGASVELSAGGGLGDNTATAGNAAAGLYIVTDAIGRDELDSDAVAGLGLSADGDDYINVGGGSGIHTDGDFINLSELGILNSNVTNADSNDLTKGIAAGKLQGGITLAQTEITAGDGLVANSNAIDITLATTDPGLTLTADSIAVDNTVVRTLATSDQYLMGDYKFKEIVEFESGIKIGGDLEVRGSTLVTEVNEVNIGDEVIVLNADYPANGSSPNSAGIECERGQLHNAELIFEETDNVWKAGKKGYAGELLTSPRVGVDTSANATNVYLGSFAMSKQIARDDSRIEMLFSDHLDIPAGSGLMAVPNVIVSIQNTGMAIYDPSTITQETQAYGDLVTAMVTRINKTGIQVDFSTAIPSTGVLSDYFCKAWVDCSQSTLGMNW
jgi:hypothetical protein